MANLATKAPNFTLENAADMARRATASRLARIAREKSEKEAADLASRARPDDARKETTLKQIDKLDKMIDAALERGKQDDFIALAAAKERLWKLVQPTAGVAKPSRRRDPEPPVTFQRPESADQKPV